MKAAWTSRAKTAPAEIPVPRDLLPALRENVQRALEGLRSDIRPATGATREQLEQFCADVERVGAASQAFALDAETYPAAALALAVKEAIEDAESRISDDHLTVDEAEFYIKRVRTYEALLGSADPVTDGDLAAWAHLADAADRALTFDGLSGTGRELLLECATNARRAAGDDGDTVAPEAKPAGRGTGVIADDAAWGRIADAAEQALAATDLSPTGREEMTNLRAAAHVAAARHVKQTGRCDGRRHRQPAAPAPAAHAAGVGAARIVGLLGVIVTAEQALGPGARGTTCRLPNRRLGSRARRFSRPGPSMNRFLVREAATP